MSVQTTAPGGSSGIFDLTAEPKHPQGALHDQYERLREDPILILQRELLEKAMRTISMKECLDYEVRASWIAGFVNWRWGQELLARYFAWKVNRKYGRYRRFMR